MGFFAIDPARGVDTAFTGPYVQIEGVTTSQEVVNHFMANRLEVAAGVKQQLELDAKRIPGLRLLPGRFMVINQAMGMRLGRAAGAQYLSAFVEDMKASGFVAQALRRHAIEQK